MSPTAKYDAPPLPDIALTLLVENPLPDTAPCSPNRLNKLPPLASPKVLVFCKSITAELDILAPPPPPPPIIPMNVELLPLPPDIVPTPGTPPAAITTGSVADNASAVNIDIAVPPASAEIPALLDDAVVPAAPPPPPPEPVTQTVINLSPSGLL